VSGEYGIRLLTLNVEAVHTGSKILCAVSGKVFSYCVGV